MKRKRRKRLGILTGGGDCFGLNAVIRAAVRSAYSLGWETVGVGVYGISFGD